MSTRSHERVVHVPVHVLNSRAISAVLRHDDTLLPFPNVDAVLADVSDGAVVYLPQTEHYFGLTPVAAVIWQMLPPAGRTLGDVCRALAERYPDVPMDTLRADVGELLDELERMHLVTPATTA